MLLAGDIGGTKTVLALFAPEDTLHGPVAQATFPSANYDSLEAVVRAFLAPRDAQIDQAVFGVAGPVMAGRAQVTNLPWLIEARALGELLHTEQVHIINDLDAIAHAVPHLGGDDVKTLVPNAAAAGGAIAVIAPGTGLGEAFLTWTGTRYEAHPSEGGHASFAPSNELQIELLRYLFPRFGHVSFERVCSGIGIPNLYAFLRDTNAAAEPDWLAAELALAADDTPVIIGNAVGAGRSCSLCAKTLELFVSILASEAGNLALKVYATGGIFIAGGIPPRILPALEGKAFQQAFREKGRFASFLAQVPVHVVTRPQVALLGAAYHGFDAFGYR